MEKFYVDLCFIGTNGLTAEKGLSTPNPEQAEIKRLMVEHSNQVIAVCGGEKIGRNALVSFAPASAIHTLITDCTADPEELEALKQANIDVICVSI